MITSVLRPLLLHQWQQEWSSLEKILTPFLLTLVILLLFGFAIPDPSDDLKIKAFAAQGFVAGFMGLQVGLMRAFEAESQDRLLDLIRTSGVSQQTFLVSKFILVSAFSLMVFLLALIVAPMLHSLDPSTFLSGTVLGIVILTTTGLSALGILLTIITIKSQNQSILYPLIFYPMSVPVLMASLTATTAMIDVQKQDPFPTDWLTLLAAFCVIFIVLMLLLGREILDPEI
jgi:heme exporter protein B